MKARTTFGCPCHRRLSHRFPRSAASSRSRGCCVPRRSCRSSSTRSRGRSPSRSGTAPSRSASTGPPGTTSPSRPSTAATPRARRCSGACGPSPTGRCSSTTASCAAAPTSSPPARSTGTSLGTSYVPDGPVTDAPDAWHPEDGALRADAARGRPPARDRLGGRAGERQAPDRRRARRARRARRPCRPGRPGGLRDRRVRPPPARARSAALRLVGALGHGLGRHDPRARLRRDPHAPSASRTSASRSSTRSPARSSRTPRSAGDSTIRPSPGRSRSTDVEPLLDPEYEVEGCYLLPNDEARRRVPPERAKYHSRLNGRGPWAWNRHWLLVPLREGDGPPRGVIWVDEPEDRLLPSADRLQALRIFANEAAAAIASAAHLDELRFLADHDPLTRLLNRRAFVERLDRRGGARRTVRPLVRARRLRPRRLQGPERPATGTRRATRRCGSSARSSRARSAGPTTRSGSAATSSPCCWPRRPRATRARWSAA